MNDPAFDGSTDRHLVLAGFYGVRNLGDELMLRCLVRWLSRAHVTVGLLSEYPEECARAYGLPAMRNVPLLGQWAWYDAWFRGRAWTLIRDLRRYDGYIGGGGDVLRDDRGWRHLSFAVEKYLVAGLSGKPWYLLNAGIAEPQTRYGRRVLELVLRRARQVIVRDHTAYELARRVRGDRDTYFAGDIVSELPRLFPEECSTAPARSVVEGHYIMVCLRGNPNVFGKFPMTETRIHNLAAALDSFAERGMRTAFFPLQQHHTEDDQDIHRRVAEQMSHRDAAVFVDWTVDIPTIASLFGHASLVVALRLHAAVLAEAFGAHTAIFPYDRKLREFARQHARATVIEATSLDRAEECHALLERALDDRSSVLGQPPPHDWLEIGFKP